MGQFAPVTVAFLHIFDLPSLPGAKSRIAQVAPLCRLSSSWKDRTELDSIATGGGVRSGDGMARVDE